MPRTLCLALLTLVLSCPAGYAQPLPRDPYRRGALVTTSHPRFRYTRVYTADPLGGVAAVIDAQARLVEAQGKYLIDIQEAKKQREEALQMKLETQKDKLEYLKWRWDFIREMRTEEFERRKSDAIKHAREDAQLTEILAGSALNILLDELMKRPSLSQGDSPEVKQAWLDNLNITSTGGNAGLLRQEEVTWPVFLQEDAFAHHREGIETWVKHARKEAPTGKISPQTIRNLFTQQKSLDSAITSELRSNPLWSPRHHIQAVRFVHELNETCKLLENPQEAQFIVKRLPRCDNVAELVLYMKENGLRFGPASAGSERHYVAFYQALRSQSKK